MRTSKTLARTVIVLLAVPFVTLGQVRPGRSPRAPGAPTQTFEEFRKDLDAQFPPVPKELWDPYTTELKRTPHYIAGKALTPEKIAPLLEQWSKDFGVTLEMESGDWFGDTFSYGHNLRENGLQSEFRIDRARLTPQATSNGPPPGARSAAAAHVGLIHQGATWKGEHTERVIEFMALLDEMSGRFYHVDKNLLRELHFPFVTSVTITHPINRRLQTFEIKNETLTQVVEKLSAISGAINGGSYDYAINSALADPVVLTMRLRNKTILECLLFATRAVGWTVEIGGAGYAMGGMRGYGGRNRWGMGGPVPDPSVSIWDVSTALQDQLAPEEDGSVSPPPSEEAVVNVLRKLISQQVEELGDSTPVITIKPAK